MDDALLIRVLARLVQVRLQYGDHCYQDAAHGALVAIGRSAMREAEARAGFTGPCLRNVVSFRRPAKDDDTRDDAS